MLVAAECAENCSGVGVLEVQHGRLSTGIWRISEERRGEALFVEPRLHKSVEGEQRQRTDDSASFEGENVRRLEQGTRTRGEN